MRSATLYARLLPLSHARRVILRCSPFFTASLEGWATSACGRSFETPRKGAAPQDDGGVCGSRRCSRQSRNAPRNARQFQNMHPRIGAVDDVDVAALVGLDIVGLDCCPAAVLAVDGH